MIIGHINIFKYISSSFKNMPKHNTFHELSTKAKIRRLNAEDVNELNSTDSSIEFGQLDIQQSYATVRSNISKI